MAGETTGSVSLSSVSLSLSSGATLFMALGGDPTSSGNAGVTFDQITETAGVFTAGGSTLHILALSSAVLGKPYPIVVAGTLGSIDSSTFANLALDSASAPVSGYTISYSPTQIDITLSRPRTRHLCPPYTGGCLWPGAEAGGVAWRGFGTA